MATIYCLLFAIILLEFLAFIDHKIKGSKSIIVKFFYLAFFTFLIVSSIYFYGETFFRLFNVDLRSFTKIKEFFILRIAAVIVVLLLFLITIVKMISFTLSFRDENRVFKCKKDKLFFLLAIVFDIAVIPNILNNVFGVVLATISFVGIGLACIKLVFSYFICYKKEVLA